MTGQTEPDQPKRPTLLEAIGGVPAELYAEACDHVNHHEAQRRLAEAEVVRLRAEVERLREALSYFAVDDSAYVEAYHGVHGLADAEVMSVAVTREHAGKLREMVGSPLPVDEQEVT